MVRPGWRVAQCVAPLLALALLMHFLVNSHVFHAHLTQHVPQNTNLQDHPGLHHAASEPQQVPSPGDRSLHP
jgi:hypothetical protein